MKSKKALFVYMFCLLILACNNEKDFSAKGKITHFTGKGPTYAIDTSNDQIPDLLVELSLKSNQYDSLPINTGDSLSISRINGVLSSPTRFFGYNLESVYFVRSVYKGRVSAFTNCGFYMLDENKKRREYQGLLFVPINLGDTVLLVKYCGDLVRYFK